MASIVDICNVALSHIGDTANVTSIAPPDGSAQAGYCATFFPVALSAMLETANWGFATVRSTTAPVANPSTTWLYAYAYPAQVVNLISVLTSDALDDYSQNFGTLDGTEDFSMGGPAFPDFSYANPADNFYSPQPYELEQDGDGNLIVLTNVCSPVFRYTMQVSDPTKFSGLFVLALSYLLASMLAGPIVKGEEGATLSVSMLTKFQAFNGQAKTSDANQRHIVVKQRVSWMAGR
jgi:hypothetical protein